MKLRNYVERCRESLQSSGGWVTDIDPSCYFELVLLPWIILRKIVVEERRDTYQGGVLSSTICSKVRYLRDGK